MGLLENMWIIKTFLYVVISMSYELEINSFRCYWDPFSVNADLCRCVDASEARSRYLAALRCMSDLKLN